ncbi:hypothetical protein [Nonomuraea typhae]|uniref:Thiazole-containing bacteriocin maturation protein n=1 Tax=Nonomuraea typhae TaxID=2603600 RepID=A0ABW7YSS9_9ACTN
MRPRLKPDVYWARLPDGVYLGSSAGQRLIRGRSIYDWLERIAPFLDGARSLEEITEGLREDHRDMVRRIVGVLAEGGYVRDTGEDEPHTLSPDMLRTYANEIAYLEYHRDSAARTFQRYCELRFLLIGSGQVFPCLVQAVLGMGPREITFATTSDSPTDLERAWEFVTEAASRDPGREVLHLGREPSAADIGSADVVLHVCDVAAVERAVALEDVCREQGTALAQALVIDGSAWVGPVLHPGSDSGSWESLWLRLRANHPAPRGRQAELTGPTASLAAHHLSFSFFRHATGVRDHGTPYHFTEIDLADLRTYERRVLPHPLVRHAAPADRDDFLAEVARLRTGSAQEEPEFSERAAALFDQRVGVFTALDERGLTQVPLYVSEAVVSDPFLTLDEPPRVTGLGQDFGEARRNATRAAAERYAGLAVDRRRGPAWGWRLSDGEAVREPTGRASAVASGLSWKEAVTCALLRACATLAPGLLTQLREPLVQAPPEILALDEEGERYLRMLRHARVAPALHDLSGLLGLPLLAVGSAERTVAYHAGLTLPDAARDCLRSLVAAFQSAHNDEPEYAPPQVPQLPAHLRGRPGLVGRPPDPGDLDGLAKQLGQRGYGPVAVPLTGDPAFGEVFPYVARVVLTDA